MSKRRTNPFFLMKAEAENEKRILRKTVRSIAGSEKRALKEKINDLIANPTFWSKPKGLVIRAIVLDHIYSIEGIRAATGLEEKYVEWALRELFLASLVQTRQDGKYYVVRELYWKCKDHFDPPPAKGNAAVESHNHISREDFLMEFFGNHARDFGSPERQYSDNPKDIVQFIETCACSKLPAFISVQPMRPKAQPLGIEKVFFDFDCCKKNEALTEEEYNCRLDALRAEVGNFLKRLMSLSIQPLVVQTRRGYHIHVYFDSVYEINQQTKFWKEVYRQLQLGLLGDDTYHFLDLAVIGDINRLCRIPLSVHEKSGQECIIVDCELKPDKLRSIEFFKLYGLKQKNLLDAIEIAKKLEASLKRKQVKFADKSTPSTMGGIRPCFVKALESGEMCHQQRLALLSEAYSLGFHSPESIIEIYRCLNDFDYSITEYQVEWFFSHWVEKGGVRPYGCRSIRNRGWCIGDQCPCMQQSIKNH